MFKNKHIIIALIVTPTLALVSYFGVDRMVSEKPHVAQSDTSYPLAAKPNCRYPSGECSLINGEFNVAIHPLKTAAGKTNLRIVSGHSVDAVKLAISLPGDEDAPQELRSADSRGIEWVTDIASDIGADSILRIVLIDGATSYYAELTTAFVQVEPANLRH